MDDARRVRGGQRIGRLREVVERPLQIAATRIDHLTQRFTPDQLHRDEVDHLPGTGVPLADFIDRQQVRMVQGRGRARLLNESRQAAGVPGERLRQDLNRDRAVKLGIVGAIDLAHAAAAQQRTDPVTAKGRA